MPVVAACLVPAAPALLPELTGGDVPELGPVRAAVAAAVRALLLGLDEDGVGPDQVVVVAAAAGSSLAGFGAGPLAAADPEQGQGGPGWPHELAGRLLQSAGSGLGSAPAARWLDLVGRRVRVDWPEVTGDLAAWVTSLQTDARRTGLLLLADGSRTHGARAPGGDDPRGRTVDVALVAAARSRRTAVVPDAAAVGATAGPAVAVLAALPGGAVQVLHDDAPLGVGYLVATWRR